MQTLAVIREADPAKLERATEIELRIVESGIRRDQGLADAAVGALRFKTEVLWAQLDAIERGDSQNSIPPTPGA